MSQQPSHRTKATPEPPYHVVATDMDGTLLNEHHAVSAHTKQTVQKLIRTYQLPSNQQRKPPLASTEKESAGAENHSAESEGNQFRVFFVLASGRHVHDLFCILKELELPDYSGYIVSSNGAKAHCLVHRHAGEGDNTESSVELKEVYAAFMLPSQVCKVYSLLPANEEEINVNIYCGEGWYCSLDWQDQLQYFPSGFSYKLFSPHEKIAEYAAFLEAQQAECAKRNEHFSATAYDDHPANPLYGVEKILLGSDNTERLQQLYRVVSNQEPAEEMPSPIEKQAFLHGNTPFDVAVTFSSKYAMEVTGAGVNKASGIDHLMPYLQRRSDSVSTWTIGDTCIAFGDGENDEQMLLQAAKGCCMSNAAPKLKENVKNAKNVEEVGANHEDGVAHKLEEIFRLAAL